MQNSLFQIQTAKERQMPEYASIVSGLSSADQSSAGMYRNAPAPVVGLLPTGAEGVSTSDRADRVHSLPHCQQKRKATAPDSSFSSAVSSSVLVTDSDNSPDIPSGAMFDWFSLFCDRFATVLQHNWVCFATALGNTSCFWIQNSSFFNTESIIWNQHSIVLNLLLINLLLFIIN